MSSKYTCLPSNKTRSLSNISKIISEDWWMMHMIACSLLASFRSKVQIDQAVSLSSPDVDSSRKISNSRRAASSTSIVKSFRCPTLRPSQMLAGRFSARFFEKKSCYLRQTRQSSHLRTSPCQEAQWPSSRRQVFQLSNIVMTVEAEHWTPELLSRSHWKDEGLVVERSQSSVQRS